MSRERLVGRRLPIGYVEAAPDLAVQIVSPCDASADVDDKVQQYLAHRTRLVWVVQPKTQSVTVYHPDRTARLLTAAAGDTLSGEEVMPGFAVSVADVFAP